ncbi:MAG: hypothetical protein IPK22_26160 [Verrucomicrobiaceae bacterium]|nr:hypothetical protein [Verrucomicrobiaceae bacterium]
MHRIAKLVRDQAGGLVFMPGFHGFQASLQEIPLADLLPVIWDASSLAALGIERTGPVRSPKPARSP